MLDSPQISIDRELCTGCGLCVPVCLYRTLEVVEGKAVVAGTRCISCGHCLAACPTGALGLAGLDPAQARFASFSCEDRWLKPGDCDPAELYRLMASRRSCRDYTDAPLARELLEDLLKIGISAPSGCNDQPWTFTLLPTRPAVLKLGEAVLGFFGKLNKLAANPLLRGLMSLVGKPELAAYYRDHYASVVQAMALWREQGEDKLFHGATAVIVVATKPANCPAEDALLATQNILLGAHALGLASCLIGYAVSAMQHTPEIQKTLGIPRDETVRAVIALGYGRQKYQGLGQRKKPLVRYCE